MGHSAAGFSQHTSVKQTAERHSSRHTGTRTSWTCSGATTTRPLSAPASTCPPSSTTRTSSSPWPRSPITTLILPAKEFYNAENYHQKYLLRKHDWLVAALGLEDDNKMISSHVAARINGYIGGYGDESSFEAERSVLNLTDEVYDYVLEEIQGQKKFGRR